jgi:glycolate oxidase iron-sulfur subunit
MQTRLAAYLRDTPAGREAERILRSCVHCGFCNATCPTYRLLGDELDGPRGRIYLMKQALEGEPVTRRTQLHLDRCLTCLSCETTCPSGVEYGRLLDLGREFVEQRVARPLPQRLARWVLRHLLPHPARLAPVLGLARALRPVLPAGLRAQLPSRTPVAPRPKARHPRRMLILEGCVQPLLEPGINAATARVLDALGIELVAVADAGCCGAISQHLGAPQEARRFMRCNIDAWWPQLERGAEAIVVTASGCGVTLRQYAHYLQDDPAYRDKAQRVSGLARDLGDILDAEDLGRFAGPDVRSIAFHAPCTLQHGLGLGGVVERLLNRLGHELMPVAEPYLCCGSAGTYSLLQPELSERLLRNKLSDLQAHGPELIASANIGCIHQLRSRAQVPVVHWIELLAERLPEQRD